MESVIPDPVKDADAVIENIINRGTKEVLGEFESITSPAVNM